MNRLESLNNVDKALNEERVNLFEQDYKHPVYSNFKEVLLNYNVAKPKFTYFKNQSIEFNLNYLLGFSDNGHQDFLQYYKSYLTRIPNNMLAIGSVDGGDLLCMDNDSGEIYYWCHEENDWGLEGNAKYPTKVGSSLNNYIESLIATDAPTKEELDRAKK